MNSSSFVKRALVLGSFFLLTVVAIPPTQARIEFSHPRGGVRLETNGWGETVVNPSVQGDEFVVRVTPTPGVKQVRVQVQYRGTGRSNVIATKESASLFTSTINVKGYTGRVDVSAYSTTGGYSENVRLYVDRGSPTFEDIAVNGTTKRLYARSPVNFTLSGLEDDGNWKGDDYWTQWTLDGTTVRGFNGTGYTWRGISDGIHTLKAKVKDGYGRYSRERSVKVFVDGRDPTVSFSSPKTKSGKAVPLTTRSKVTVSLAAGDPGTMTTSSGLSHVSLYLDALPGGEFGPKGRLLHTFKGPWLRGFANKAEHTLVVDFPLGSHDLLAVATDQAGNSHLTRLPVVVLPARIVPPPFKK